MQRNILRTILCWEVSKIWFILDFWWKTFGKSFKTAFPVRREMALVRLVLEKTSVFLIFKLRQKVSFKCVRSPFCLRGEGIRVKSSQLKNHTFQYLIPIFVQKIFEFWLEDLYSVVKAAIYLCRKRSKGNNCPREDWLYKNFRFFGEDISVGLPKLLSMCPRKRFEKLSREILEFV